MRRGRSDVAFLVLLGLVVGLFVGVVLGSQLPRDAPAADPDVSPDGDVDVETPSRAMPEPSPLVVPQATLTVHTDGCGVIRSEVPDDQQDGLTWNVYDVDGFQVLGRVADNETRYRYFVPGTYTVSLDATVGGEYVTISNTVEITC